MTVTTEIAPNVHQLALKGAHGFLLDTTAGLVLVDCGLPDSTGRLTAGLRELDRTPSDIVAILVTHAHPDHFGGLAELRHLTGAPVWMHAADAEHVERGASWSDPRQPAPGLGGIVHPLTHRLLGRMIAGMAGKGLLPPTPVDHRVDDGDELPGGPTVLHVPGTTEGSVAVFWQGTLLAGDALSSNPGFGGHQFSYHDRDQALASMRRLIDLDPKAAGFGHGRPILDAAGQKMRRWLS